jgi:hypothetical protein
MRLVFSHGLWLNGSLSSIIIAFVGPCSWLFMGLIRHSQYVASILPHERDAEGEFRLQSHCFCRGVGECLVMGFVILQEKEISDSCRLEREREKKKVSRGDTPYPREMTQDQGKNYSRQSESTREA